MFEKKNDFTLFPFLVCGLAALFLFYEFVLQILPSVMTHSLMEDFRIDAATLGLMTAFYFYAYTPMQLFAGLAFDRLGARITLTGAALACSLGALLFSSAQSVPIAAIGRFLTGGGSAFGYIGVLFLGAAWFKPKYFYLVAGLTELMGCLGAVGGQAPSALAVAMFGWRSTIFYLAIFGCALSVLIWFVVRDHSSKVLEKKKTEPISMKANLLFVLKNNQAWALGLYALAVFAPISAFASLWGVPFLKQAYHLSATEAALSSSLIWIGMGLGSPMLCWLSESMGNRRIPLFSCAIFGIFVTTIILFCTGIPVFLLKVLLFFFGVATAGQALSFSVVKDNFPPHTLGTAMGFNNMLIVLSGAIFQPLTGLLLRYFWTGQILDGVPAYSTESYQYALCVLPFCYALGAFICWAWLRETRCQQVGV